jgi:hypothetical protein
MKAKRYRTGVAVLAVLALGSSALRFMPYVAQVRLGSLGHSPSRAAIYSRVEEAYGKLPLSFEANQGQADPRVHFQARGTSYSLLLTQDSAILALRGTNPNDRANSTELKPKLQEPRRLNLPRNAQLASSTARLPRTYVAQGKGSLFVMTVVGADPNARVEGLGELSGKSNYFIGSDPRRWHTNVPNYAMVKYTNVYPGVDLVYHGNQGRLEYDFVVEPGADSRQITLAFQSSAAKSGSMSELRIDRKGDLVVVGGGSEVRFRRPVVYQPTIVNTELTRDERRRVTGNHFVDGEYVLKDGRVMFKVAAYDQSKPLVIDPILVYSTYVGGSGWDHGYAIAVDSSGDAYLTGRTGSLQFPTTAGAFSTKPTPGGYADAFVTELNAAGSALVYSTYLGGSFDDEGDGIAVDAGGETYVTGWTASANFPTTAGAFQTTMGGGFDDAFVTKLNATGSELIYSTYLGGNSHDEGHAVALDTSGDAYVTGLSYSPNFPTTAGALRTSLRGLDDAFVTELDHAGSGVVYSTYLGGTSHDDGRGIAVDASGEVYVVGSSDSTDFPITAGAYQAKPGGGYDAFVSKLNSNASALIYSTYLGGVNDDFGRGIAVDASGNAYLTGDSYSANFPTTAGAFETTLRASSKGYDDAFVTKLNAAGSAVYSTYLGGSNGDIGYAIAVDRSGNALVTGATFSFDFPTTANALQPTPGGADDAFFSKLNSAGSALVYSTYLAGKGLDEGHGIALDSAGNAYITGWTSSTNFPVTTGAFETILVGDDAFVAKISAQ